jgi:hypothetical protein
MIYRDMQTTILTKPPFSTSRTLISTHHCMHLLVSYLRRTLSPEAPHTQNDSWISLLLTTSGLARIVEFFAAEKGIGGSQRAKRRDFMRKMQADWEERRKVGAAAMVFGTSEESTKPPPIREIWFEAAKMEMLARNAAPHQTEEWVEIWDNGRISVGCANCEGEEGWQA